MNQKTDFSELTYQQLKQLQQEHIANRKKYADEKEWDAEMKRIASELAKRTLKKTWSIL